METEQDNMYWGEKRVIVSNTLLQLIARLQYDTSVAHGRHVLLDYVRKSSGARLAVLFQLPPFEKTRDTTRPELPSA